MKAIKTLIILLPFLFCSIQVSAQNTIEFRVRLMEEEPAKEMGLRGGFAPLSWDKDIVLEDTDGDGVYRVQIEFPDSLSGKTLEYKFLKDGIWERQDIDNRKLELNGEKQILPVGKWQIHSDRYLFNKMSRSYFGKFIFIFHLGKKQGKNPKEIVWEMIEYYNWSPNNWPATPNDVLGGIKSGQDGHQGGYFEVLEDTPGKVKFIMGRYWLEWFDLYGPGLGMDKNGDIQGVSKDDLEIYYRTWFEYYCTKNNNNWELLIEEEGDSKWIVTFSDQKR